MPHWLEADRATLIAKAVALGFSEADANLWLDRLLASRSGVQADKIAAKIAAFDSVISAFTAQRDRTVQGRAWIVTNAPNNAVKTATLQSIDDAIAALNVRISKLQADRDELAS